MREILEKLSLRNVAGRTQAGRGFYNAIERLKPAPLPRANHSIFALSVDETVEAMSRHALASSFCLPEQMAERLACFAEAAELKHESLADRFYLYQLDQQRFRSLPLAYVDQPLASLDVQLLTEDPFFHAVFERYLGFAPKGVEARIWFSFANVEASESQRRAHNQTIDYHYDAGFGKTTFFYASFYLSDVDLAAGPHSLFLGSHKRKRLDWLFRSARRSREELIAFYGEQSEKTLIGPAGTGFLEDASCFHRAAIPTSKNRLILQLRFY